MKALRKALSARGRGGEQEYQSIDQQPEGGPNAAVLVSNTPPQQASQQRPPSAAGRSASARGAGPVAYGSPDRPMGGYAPPVYVDYNAVPAAQQQYGQPYQQVYQQQPYSGGSPGIPVARPMVPGEYEQQLEQQQLAQAQYESMMMAHGGAQARKAYGTGFHVRTSNLLTGTHWPTAAAGRPQARGEHAGVHEGAEVLQMIRVRAVPIRGRPLHLSVACPARESGLCCAAQP